jgi:hypothetical protein
MCRSCRWTRCRSPWPCGSADLTPSGFGPRAATAALVSLLVLWLAACTSSDSARGPAPDGSSTAAAKLERGDLDAFSRKVVLSQQRALSGRYLQHFMSTWAATQSARQEARDIAVNLRALHASVLDMHVPRSAPADAPERGPGRTSALRWQVAVDVVWRTPEMGRGRAVSPLTYTFGLVRGRARVTDIRPGPGSREPIWLAGRRHVDRRRGVVAVATTAAAARGLARRLQVAKDDVGRFLPSRHRGLTAYLPRDAADFEALIGATPQQYGSVAAVTTSVDGSNAPQAPVAIVANPAVWRRLRPVGAHVVITHEAVHAFTGARTADLPDWVAEGFADYVAVRSADISTAVADAAAFKRVRELGLPRRLPTRRDFRLSAPNLEATYELSRLVMVTIADRHGPRRLVRFYTDLAAHPSDLAGALRRQLGTSQAELTQQWRRLLVGLAGAQ